jgi:hypothetical protein
MARTKVRAVFLGCARRNAANPVARRTVAGAELAPDQEHGSLAALAAFTNSPARLVSSAQLPSCNSLADTNEDPTPTAAQPAFRKSATLPASTPPVGTMRRCGKGARIALM